MEGRWCEETQREDVHLQAKKREALNWLPSKPYKKPTLKAPTRSLPSKPYKKPTLMNLDFRLAASRWRKNTFLLSLSHPVCGIYSSPSKLKQYVNYTPKKLLPKSQKKKGLPWWRSGWESACQCRGHGFEPWSGTIPHVAEQLGPWATTTEPERLEPLLCNKRGRDSERPAHRDEEWLPLAATGKSPRTETKTQHSQK